ncbi:iron ABC transporter substrate-binding protein [Aceticella autotrophica]|uniref:Iron ABC transporter substrate-binding protein n=1 Tax=Aceticella autotrophica TaxID=2755338 RepID=A0A975AUN6_9THEO|nr:iron ABC transporter substrate-binding protein [Aceticella autotrophica]QSZ26774.1 iron ABC transporter substrate-binding protein [Aceticella autotrophica]
MKKKLCFLMVFVLLLSLLSGCGANKSSQTTKSSASEPQKVVITDVIGRQVEVPIPAKKIVSVNESATRLISYLDGLDKVVGIETLSKFSDAYKPYLLAHPELKNLPQLGKYNSLNAEEIIKLKPDVIFYVHYGDMDPDKLQAQTHIPVVALKYGDKCAFTEDVYKSLQIIGRIIDKEKRTQEVVSYLKRCEQDLSSRTNKISDNKKPKVYISGIGFYGVHGIESTQGKYRPLNLINAKNVADETGKTGSIIIDKEKLLNWDPDIIFIDEFGLSLVKDDYKKNPQFYQSIKAVKEGQIYTQLPYVCYDVNIENAIADAYWNGKVIFPEQFKDINPEQKADDIYKFLLGKPLYKDMVNSISGFKKLNLGS